MYIFIKKNKKRSDKMTDIKQMPGGIFIQAEAGSGPIEINYLQLDDIAFQQLRDSSKACGQLI